MFILSGFTKKNSGVNYGYFQNLFRLLTDPRSTRVELLLRNVKQYLFKFYVLTTKSFSPQKIATTIEIFISIITRIEMFNKAKSIQPYNSA